MELQTFSSNGIDELRNWFADEASLIQWGGPEVRFPLDREQLQAMLDEGEGARPKRWLFNGVRDGAVFAHTQAALDWRHGVARLGRVAVKPAFRGQGLAAPFLQLIIDRLFQQPEFERVELHVYTFNTVAIRTYEALGFRQDGVRRSSVRVGAERWDTAIFGLLRGEARSVAS